MEHKDSNIKYQPIENYGVIGDLNTVALIGLNGSIDFLCFPRFDSPTVFAALLDTDKGGYFKISPDLEDVKFKQLYIPETNVLLTRFLSSDGIGEITDFMPAEEMFEGNVLIRRVTSVMGRTKYKMEFCPRFNYARSKHSVEIVNSKEIIFKSLGDDGTTLRLYSDAEIKIINGDGFAEFEIKQGDMIDFILELYDKQIPKIGDSNKFVTENLHKTIKYWKDWSEVSNYTGRWREIVNRSALVLKLLTSFKYGSMVASPTFSLPEALGGERNWDYRYTWIRDASFSIYSLIKLGYTNEATAFMKWIEKECQDLGNAGNLSLMYTVEGENVCDEIELEHFEGYRKSKPVRIGNNAKDQIQLDIYGELMDAVYLYNKHVEPISIGFWNELVEQMNWLCKNWWQKDEGIWEVRGGKKEFLYSRLMCWVALDRAIKITELRSLPLPPCWIEERNKIFKSIFDDFWDEELQAFVQYKGAKTVDAAALFMPIMRFISAKDPLWLSTMKLIEEKLVSDSLVYRYRHDEAAYDGMKSNEGTFSMCTFWYIECLSRSGQIEKARFFFEKMIGYANHLGLYAEQLGFQGEHLGNYPQAFTHLGLIATALHLNKSLMEEKEQEKGNIS